MPAVSVIIPVHNRAAELRETLDCLIAQTLEDWEAIIVDDRSTDGADRVAQDYAADDPRFRPVFLPEDKSGAPAARNLGVSRSQGEFILFLDSDDLLSPTALEQRVARMRAKPSLDFTLNRCQQFRTKPGDVALLWNADTGEDDLIRFLKWDMPWQTSSPLWRRSSLAKVGPWDENAPSAQDWEFHTRALLASVKYERSDVIDHYWRMPGGDRESIGRDAWKGKAHALARPGVINRVVDRFEKLGRLDERAKRLFAGLLFHSAEEIARKASRVVARQVWAEAHDRGLITLSQRFQGERYLFALRWPDRARMLRVQIQRDWPAEIAVRSNPFFNKAPLDPARAPTVSWVISIYNNLHHVEEAMDSMIYQSFRDWEMILIDDGSTDGTREIVQRYAANDCRIKLTLSENKGRTAQLNEALKQARGEFLARMDCDDVCTPDRLEKQVAFMRANPDVVAIGSQVEIIDPFGVTLETRKLPTDHATLDQMIVEGQGGAIVHPVAMFRKTAVDKVGGYDPAYNDVEDLEIYLRLGEVGKFANHPDVLLKYRQHHNSVNATRFELQKVRNRKAREEACKRRGLPMPTTFPFESTKFLPKRDQIHAWGWYALKKKQLDAARQHARELLKLQPFWIESWRLMYCAWRGR
jgi:glycosyltransferase involved in cell wall biosynthesis